MVHITTHCMYSNCTCVHHCCRYVCLWHSISNTLPCRFTGDPLDYWVSGKEENHGYRICCMYGRISFAVHLCSAVSFTIRVMYVYIVILRSSTNRECLLGTHACIHTRSYMYTCTHTCTHTSTHTHTHTRTHTYANIHMHTYAPTHMHTYVHTQRLQCISISISYHTATHWDTIAIGHVLFKGSVYYTPHGLKNHQGFTKYEKGPSIDIYCTGPVDWTSGFDWSKDSNLCNAHLPVELCGFWSWNWFSNCLSLPGMSSPSFSSSYVPLQQEYSRLCMCTHQKYIQPV